jgi:hypothetical protein
MPEFNKNMNYLAFDYINFKMLACRSDLSVLCDYLYILQTECFTICPVENEKLFEDFSTVGLYKMYLSLGGDKSVYETAQQIMQQRLRLLKECRRLAMDYPTSMVTTYHVSMQASWLEKQDIKKGYQYKHDSLVPKKVI